MCGELWMVNTYYYLKGFIHKKVKYCKVGIFNEICIYCMRWNR